MQISDRLVSTHFLSVKPFVQLGQEPKPEQILISNQRLAQPLQSTDHFFPIPCYLPDSKDIDVDLLELKRQAKESGKQRAERVALRAGNAIMTQSEIIFAILQLNRYRRGHLDSSQSLYKKYIEQIERCIRNQLPIVLLTAFFPCKVRNPLKTFATAGDEVDLAELGALLRLYEITQAIATIHAPGARFIVACDGARYKSLAGHSQRAIDGYIFNIKRMINYLGIDSSVELVDEALMYPQEFADVCHRNSELIARSYREGDTQISEVVNKLLPNLAFMLDLDPMIPFQHVALAYASDLSSARLRSYSNAAYDLRHEIDRRALEATIGYVAANLAMLQLDVVARACPNTIKLTVHPKPGELGFYPVNKASDNVFPHNGQGHMSFSNTGEDSIDKIRVSFVADLMRNNADARYQSLVLPSSKYPFSNGSHPFCIVKRQYHKEST